MNTLSYGSRGPQVQLLQLALGRAGFDPGSTDGAFGPLTQSALRRFQAAADLVPDGIAGVRTHAALRPYYTGYRVHTLRPGDSFYRLAMHYGTGVAAIAAANPTLNPGNLPVGKSLVIPLNFEIVPTAIDWCSELVGFCCEGIAARYPIARAGQIGKSVMGRPLHLLLLGSGPRHVLYQAEHHANEWLTTPLLLHFAEALARAAGFGGSIYGLDARSLLEDSTLALIPAVNPDGLDLVTGALRSGRHYDAAAAIAADYPDIAFPAGWKANIAGTDLNLQYPAGWENARDIKYAQGFTAPAPRDYVGTAALSAPESRAMYDFTVEFAPALTLSYHSQGEVIYWKYLNYDPPGAKALADAFATVSGYAVETTPYASGFAGYKDWFIQTYNLPGFTIEVGLGENPLPTAQFGRIAADNLGILALGLVK